MSTLLAADEALLLVAALVLAFTIALFLVGGLLTRLLVSLLVGLGLRQLTDRGPADGTLELLILRGLILPCDDAGGVEDVATLELDGLAVILEAAGADDARLLEESGFIHVDLERFQALTYLVEEASGLSRVRVVENGRDLSAVRIRHDKDEDAGATDRADSEDAEYEEEDRGDARVLHISAVVFIRSVKDPSVDDPAGDREQYEHHCC